VDECFDDAVELVLLRVILPDDLPVETTVPSCRAADPTRVIRVERENF
jgi:antitoxin component of RelBE/YafQ-DinJ toxin-antitoxin module